MRSRLLALTCAAMILSPFSSDAQSVPTQLSGRVIDDASGEPISGVAVEIVDARGRVVSRVLTDGAGAFQAVLPESAGYRFRTRRIGFADVTTPLLRPDAHNVVQIEIRLDAEAVLLAPLEVTAWARTVRPSPITEGFRDRMASGIGYFVTREQIEERKPIAVSDMLLTIPGVQLRSSGRGSRRAVYMTRTGESCPALIFVDGFLYNEPGFGPDGFMFTLDEAVAPSDVEGIEVYHGLGTIPAQFLSPEARCGVVAVWTRRGG